MDINIVKHTSKATEAECIIIPISKRGIPKSLTGLNLKIVDLINDYTNSFKDGHQIGRCHLIHHQNQGILLIGVGDGDTIDRKNLREIVTKLVSYTENLTYKTLTNYLVFSKFKGLRSDKLTQAIAEDLIYGSYHFNQLKTNSIEESPTQLHNLVLPSTGDIKRAVAGIKLGKSIANGIALARDLGNLPANICTPGYLAEQAKEITKTNKNFSINILELKDMEKLKMGGILSVTRGSVLPPKFIVLNYQGTKKSIPPIIFCGKGITFDTGGISLKPPGRMDEMKFDMCGAASVLGLARCMAEYNPKVNFMVLVPTCENMPSGTATRPGDIIKTYSGKTVEVLNTDAEGRLILCDALSYALQYKPKAIVDIATLTGACVVALGTIHSGLFGNNTKLIVSIKKSAKTTGDTVWHLPIDEEYGVSMNSNFADFANVGSSRDAGASLAAQFLSRFVDDTPWAHIDIAGTAYHTGTNKLSTGRPVALLANLLLNAS